MYMFLLEENECFLTFMSCMSNFSNAVWIQTNNHTENGTWTKLANIRVQTKPQFWVFQTHLIQLIEWFRISSWGGSGVLGTRKKGPVRLKIQVPSEQNVFGFKTGANLEIASFWWKKKHWDVDWIESNNKPREKKNVKPTQPLGVYLPPPTFSR